MAKILLGISSSFCAGFIEGQAADLKQRGHDVLILSGPGPEISRLAHHEGAKLITLPFTRSFTPLRDLIHLIQILRILRKEKPDIVNAGNPKSGFLILFAAWLKRVPFRVFTLHGLVSDHRKGLVKSIVQFSEKASAFFAHQVVVVSHQLRAHAIQQGLIAASNSRVLGAGSCNGLKVDRFTKTPSLTEAAHVWRQENDLTSSHVVLGFVGRINVDKGIEVLLPALDQVWEMHPQVRLLLVGPIESGHGLSAHTLHRLYEDPRICYVGKQADMPLFYAAMDFLVLPSFREGLPYVLLEAASMGVPIIASEISGCTDLIKDGQSGLLFPPGQATALSARLEKALLDPQGAQQMAQVCQQNVRMQFNQDQIWDALYQLYQEGRLS